MQNKLNSANRYKSYKKLNNVALNLMSPKKLKVDSIDLDNQKDINIVKKSSSNSRLPLSPVVKSRNIPSLAGSRTTMHSTLFKNSPQKLKKLSLLSNKLGYEWKFIYRDLRQNDLENSGKWDSKMFLDTLNSHKVKLTNEEWKLCQREYSDKNLSMKTSQYSNLKSVLGQIQIDYQRISKELNLHKMSYDYINPAKSIREKLKMQSTGYGTIFATRTFKSLSPSNRFRK